MPLIITRAGDTGRDQDGISARWDGPLLVRHADLTHAIVRGMALDAFFSGERGPLCRDQCACAVFGGRGPLPDGLKTIVWRAMPDAPLRRAGWDVASVAGTPFAAADRAEMIAEHAQVAFLGSWDRECGFAFVPGQLPVSVAMYVPHEAHVHASLGAAQRECRERDIRGLIVVTAGRRIMAMA